MLLAEVGITKRSSLVEAIYSNSRSFPDFYQQNYEAKYFGVLLYIPVKCDHVVRLSLLPRFPL